MTEKLLRVERGELESWSFPSLRHGEVLPLTVSLHGTEPPRLKAPSHDETAGSDLHEPPAWTSTPAVPGSYCPQAALPKWPELKQTIDPLDSLGPLRLRWN